MLSKSGVDGKIAVFPLQNEGELLKEISNFDIDPQLWKHLLSSKIKIFVIGLFSLTREHWIFQGKEKYKEFHNKRGNETKKDYFFQKTSIFRVPDSWYHSLLLIVDMSTISVLCGNYTRIGYEDGYITNNSHPTSNWRQRQLHYPSCPTSRRL